MGRRFSTVVGYGLMFVWGKEIFVSGFLGSDGVLFVCILNFKVFDLEIEA